MTEYPDESYDELVRLANLRPPGPGVNKLARNYADTHMHTYVSTFRQP